MLGPTGGKKKHSQLDFQWGTHHCFGEQKQSQHITWRAKQNCDFTTNHATHKSKEQHLLQQQIKKNTSTKPPVNMFIHVCFWSEVYTWFTWPIDKRSNGSKHFGMPWQWYLARSSPNGCRWEGLQIWLRSFLFHTIYILVRYIDLLHATS